MLFISKKILNVEENMEIIKFNSFSNNYNWLSNFYKQHNLIELKIFNVSIFFNSIEPAFQSLKLFHLEENLKIKI